MKSTEYKINFTTIDGEVCQHIWMGYPLRNLNPDYRPHTKNGINFIDQEVDTFIPWHQIKKSSFSTDEQTQGE